MKSEQMFTFFYFVKNNILIDIKLYCDRIIRVF